MHDVATRFRATPSENFGCNNNKSLRPSTSYPALTTRLLVSAAAALLVIASAGLGALFAWRVGSKHDAVLGALSVAMAIGLEITKPFAISGAFASLRQWHVITAAALTLVGASAIAYSLQAELTFMSATRGDLVAERASEVGAAQRAEERYRKAEAEIAALRPAGTSKNATAAYLDRRDALQAEMRAAEQDRRAMPVVAYADPGAVALSAYIGALGVKTDPQQLGLWLPLVGVLALEIGAAFSVVLVRSVNGQSGPQPESPALTGDSVAHEHVAHVDTRKSGPSRATKPKRRQHDDDDFGPPKRGVAGLLEVVKGDGGVINLSQRKLARRLGASRTTLQRALNDLAVAGAVILNTSRAGTTLAVA